MVAAHESSGRFHEFPTAPSYLFGEDTEKPRRCISITDNTLQTK